MLHKASTFNLDSQVLKCAHDLQDESLLAKLSAGDMIALEAKYHLQCLVSLYNKANLMETDISLNNNDKLSQGIALAEFLTYIDEERNNGEVAPIFKLSDIVKLYSSLLEHLGIKKDV